MVYRLLISVDVVEFIERLPARVRKALRNGIADIHQDPLGRSDALDCDESGRPLYIAVIGEFALTYGVDDADWHLKILEIQAADR